MVINQLLTGMILQATPGATPIWWPQNQPTDPRVDSFKQRLEMMRDCDFASQRLEMAPKTTSFKWG